MSYKSKFDDMSYIEKWGLRRLIQHKMREHLQLTRDEVTFYNYERPGFTSMKYKNKKAAYILEEIEYTLATPMKIIGIILGFILLGCIGGGDPIKNNNSR